MEGVCRPIYRGELQGAAQLRRHFWPPRIWRPASRLERSRHHGRKAAAERRHHGCAEVRRRQTGQGRTIRARLSRRPGARPAILAGDGRSAAQESGVLCREPRPLDLCRRALCTARSALEGLYQISAGDPARGRSGQGQHQDADADQLRRICEERVRWLCDLLSDRRAGRVQGRRHAGGTASAE